MNKEIICVGKEVIHIRLEEPKQHRKEILGFAIAIVHMLKKYEEYRRIQKEKNLYKTYLVKNRHQLITMLNKFQTMMPYVELEEEKPEVIPIPKPTATKKKKVIQKEELGKFEREIENIKSKIDRL